MSNRRARRANMPKNASTAASTATGHQELGINDIPLKQAQRGPSHRQAKTLIQIAEERKMNLRMDPDAEIVYQSIDSDGTLRTMSGGEGEVEDDENAQSPKTSRTRRKAASAAPAPEPERDPPEKWETYLSSLLHAITLTTLHQTLHILVLHQYSPESPFLSSSSSTFSILTTHFLSPRKTLAPFLAYLTLLLLIHPHASKASMQILFAIGSIISGWSLLQCCNDDPYLAVMRKAPGLGTVWVWCVLELKQWWLAAGCVLGVLGAGWMWKGWGFW